MSAKSLSRNSANSRAHRPASHRLAAVAECYTAGETRRQPHAVLPCKPETRQSSSRTARGLDATQGFAKPQSHSGPSHRAVEREIVERGPKYRVLVSYQPWSYIRRFTRGSLVLFAILNAIYILTVCACGHPTKLPAAYYGLFEAAVQLINCGPFSHVWNVWSCQ